MKLGIGTVQFGMDYGISNQEGRTSADDVRAIMEFARDNGIDVIDTAYSYGDSEHVLGMILNNRHGFRIITKTPVFGKEKIGFDDSECLKSAFHESLKRLRQPRVSGLLIHDAEDLLVEGGDLLYSSMLRLKDDGLAEKIGVSAYTGKQIDYLFERYEFDMIQVPVSVLDQRLIRSGHLVKLKERGIDIYARSVFLQGLLLVEPDSLSSFWDPVRPLLSEYRDFLRSHDITPVEGALGFVSMVNEIDCVIVGINNVGQLKADFKDFNKSCNEHVYNGFKSFSLDDPVYLDPSLWRLK